MLHTDFRGCEKAPLGAQRDHVRAGFANHHCGMNQWRTLGVITNSSISKKTWQQKAWLQQGLTDQRVLQTSSLGSTGRPHCLCSAWTGLEE